MVWERDCYFLELGRIQLNNLRGVVGSHGHKEDSYFGERLACETKLNDKVRIIAIVHTLSSPVKLVCNFVHWKVVS